ncbi:MAG: translocation/assembly module TamB domain-containing protein [Muribaculaceae bacterium]|nr:translocation/assembly module TamB domain-containing protein [Muribaculaceae bacterium]
MQGSTNFSAQADINTRTREYDANVDLKNVNWKLDGKSIVAESADATLYSCDTLTEATFNNEDNHLVFSSPEGIEALTDKFTKAGNIVMSQIDKRAVDIDTLKQALPQFDLDVKMGPDGIVQRLLETQEVDFREVSCKVRNDSNLFVDGKVNSLSVGSRSIDTLTFKATEWNKYLAFNAHMGNRPGTWDDYAQVNVEGGIRGSTIDFLVKQQNIKKETGYRLGCNATLTDKSVNMRFFPQEPIIGYRKWTVNDSNYVNFDYTDRMLDANLRLESDSSVVALRTKRNPEAGNEDILLDVDNLRIEEWTQLVPSLAPMTGRMDANLDLKYDGKNAEGTGDIHLKDFTYDGYREGDLAMKANYSIDPATASTRINADLLMDGARVAIASGVLNDSTSTNPLNVALTLDRFPLRKVSPFIPGNMVRLRGYANGQLQLNGKTDAPLLNGYLVGDSAVVAIPKYGASLTLSEDRIPVSNNIIRFSNYKLHGHNGNSVAMNGVVDMRNISKPVIDLRLNGKNVQVINSEQKPYSEIFGKGYVDVDATVRSQNNNMNVRADVTMLPTSNITYVMKDEVSPLNATNRVDEKMVTFINVNDSTDSSPLLVTAAESYATTIQANIDVEQGSKINVFLSEDGKDRATVDGSGRLKYTLDFTGKDNLNGTYTIENGNVRYTPPLIAQKNFDIASGSTITWTGDMLNPQLNLSGTQRSKTSVSNSDSGSRLVDFLISAKVGGTLSNIDLSFDMSSENDMAVQNELQSMSADQRSQAAINMLLYGTYTGTNGMGAMSGFNANTALFSFLQSQLNNWAQKAIKGVDLSFGINQYQGAKSGGTETSYSYRLSKNLFNDRFKIVVGGEYSTDATAEQNFGQNLISDISMEYNLNDQGSRYLRLFRHTGYESVLEGRVTKTGVGFVMKHKVGSLNDLFRKSFNKQVTAPIDTVATFKDDDPFGHLLAPDTLNTQNQ